MGALTLCGLSSSSSSIFTFRNPNPKRIPEHSSFTKLWLWRIASLNPNPNESFHFSSSFSKLWPWRSTPPPASSPSWKALALPPPPPDSVEDGTLAPSIIFRRSSCHTHFEFTSSLEALQLSKLSSETSGALATSMGLQTAAAERGLATPSTPVVVSVDVSPERRGLRLDGIVRTAMALRCNKCLGPIAERVFANFSLFLAEDPVLEPNQQSIGVVLGNVKGSRLPDENDEGHEVLDLDLDDKMHFPRSQKEIDLSKYIRDTVHLEIPLYSICSPGCRGMCYDCGANLNTSSCKCPAKGANSSKSSIWSPLEQLKKQMQEEPEAE